MKCRYCGCLESKVLDSRSTDEGASIRRRRECLSCGRRFTTYEVVDEIPVVVVKKDGRREPFDRNKIVKGLLRACEKRPVSVLVMERIADEIEREVRVHLEREISSEVIGDMVMERLKEADDVSYVRFASVYRQFTDVTGFVHELEELLKNKQTKRG